MKTPDRDPARERPRDPDGRKGAIEGDRPDEPQNFNANAGALDENGLPRNTVPICEDVIGGNVDSDARTGGAAAEAVRADEAGRAPAAGGDQPGRRDP